MQKYSVPINAIITLTKINKDYIVETLDTINELGISDVAMMLLASVGNVTNDMKGLYLEYSEWETLLLELTNLKKNNKLPVNLGIVQTGESKYPWELYLPFKNNNRVEDLRFWINPNISLSFDYNDFGCTAGKDNFAVDGYGNVYGCSLMLSEKELVAGNILEYSLTDIWNNSDIFKKMRESKLDMVEGRCKECELLYKCQGGCRACAFSLTRSLNGSDKRCPLCK